MTDWTDNRQPFDVTARSVKWFSIPVKVVSTLRVDLRVETGDAVDAQLLTGAGKAQFDAGTPYRGASCIPSFSRVGCRSLRVDALVLPDTYTLVIANPTFGILSTGMSAGTAAIWWFRDGAGLVQEILDADRDMTDRERDLYWSAEGDNLPHWQILAAIQNVLKAVQDRPDSGRRLFPMADQLLRNLVVTGMIWEGTASDGPEDLVPITGEWIGYTLDLLQAIGAAGKDSGGRVISELSEDFFSGGGGEWLREFVRGLRAIGYSDRDLDELWIHLDRLGADRTIQRRAGRTSA